MSAYACILSRLPEMYGAEKHAHIQSKAKIHFAEFVRPEIYWPQPYSIEQAFQVYRWMVKTGKPFSEYGKYGVYDLLIGSGCMGSSDLFYNPISSLEMLQRKFHRAILARPNCSASLAWIEKEKIVYGQHRILHFPHYAPFVGSPLLDRIMSEHQIQKLLKTYFSVTGNLRVQLNSCHAAAIEIIQAVVRVDTYDFKFVFDLHYGYEGSGWWHHLAEGENFIDTFGKALVEFERVSGKSLIDGLKR